MLGGGGLFAAFPAAYAVLMPALYLPIYLMLIALILRGVAFEFRHSGRRHGKRGWTIAFVSGSTLAAFAQGLVLGGFIQGVTVRDGAFAGGPLDWLTPHSVLVGLGLVAGYALLGATWLVWKTSGELHGDARRWAWRAAALTALFLATVSLATLFAQPRAAERWGVVAGHIDWPRLLRLSPIPLLGLAGLGVTGLGLMRRSHGWPHVGAALVFLSGYLGLAAGFFPYVAPYALTFRQAASTDNALGFMLGGLVIVAPLILGYTVWVYWLFRGKVGGDAGYH